MKEKNYMKFNTYEIVKMSIEKKHSDEFSREETIEELGHFYNVVPLKEDFSEIITYQGVTFSGNKEHPYRIEVILKGSFTLFLKDKKETEDMILFNIPAIQYPYVRSAVSALCASTNLNTSVLILPTVNFFKAMENIKLEDIVLDPEKIEEIEE